MKTFKTQQEIWAHLANGGKVIRGAFEDKLFKLKLLYIFIINALKAWKEFIWDVELDELYCCNGRECGCQGITNRQQIMWQNNMLPPKPIVINFDRESFVKDGQDE